MPKSTVLQAVGKLARGNKQTEKELIEIYIRQTSLQIKQLQAYLPKENWKGIQKTTHSIKSSFLYFAMARPIELADIIMETAGKNKKATKQQVNELMKICLEVIKEFKEEQKKEA